MVCEFSGFHQTTIKIRHVSCSRPLKYGVKCMEHSIISYLYDGKFIVGLFLESDIVVLINLSCYCSLHEFGCKCRIFKVSVVEMIKKR